MGHAGPRASAASPRAPCWSSVNETTCPRSRRLTAAADAALRLGRLKLADLGLAPRDLAGQPDGASLAQAPPMTRAPPRGTPARSIAAMRWPSTRASAQNGAAPLAR